MGKQYFTPEVFAFLSELANNNEKAWWEDNKQRYIEVIKEPAKEFIADFEPRLHKLSPHFVADTRTNGGSLMRPYRDTRFAKERTGSITRVRPSRRIKLNADWHGNAAPALDGIDRPAARTEANSR